jgi:hypothetical protein
MSKAKIPVELAVILKDLSIVEPDASKLLSKVKQRAALQVNDYVEIMLSKLNVAKEGTRSLADTVADTREILIGVEQEDEGREQRHEARVVV